MRALLIGDIFRIEVPEDWHDATAHLGADAPFTLAKPEGAGVLQFSMAQYTGGPRPQAVTADDLQRHLTQFAEQNDLTEPFDPVRREPPAPLTVGASFATPTGEFLRAWYLSDGTHFVFASYTCPWRERSRGEVPECEVMLTNATFRGDAAGESD
jgi:hypothetical protein